MQPARHQFRLARHHRRQQRADGMFRRRRRGVMAGDGMRGQQAHRFAVAAHGEILERADAQMARGHAREHGAGQCHAAQHVLAGGNRRQRPCGRHAERRHGLADDVLAQHRAEGGAPVTAAREGRAAGAFELDVAPRAIPPHHFAEQDGAPVAQLRHELAELVPGIGERDRRRPLGHNIAGQDFHPFGAGQRRGVESELFGQGGIHPDQPGCGHRRRVELRIQAFRQAGVAVVEAKADGHGVSGAAIRASCS